MPNWRIYYPDDIVVEGQSSADWRAAPNDRVQVICVLEPAPMPFPSRHETGFVACQFLKPDRAYYTGVDEYDSLGYGVVKTGSLLSDQNYFEIWDRAYGSD